MVTQTYSIAIHGGAGTILRSEMTLEKELAYKAALTEAIKAGEQLLKQRGSALDAVEVAITSLENNPLFNLNSVKEISLDDVKINEKEDDF